MKKKKFRYIASSFFICELAFPYTFTYECFLHFLLRNPSICHISWTSLCNLTDPTSWDYHPASKEMWGEGLREGGGGGGHTAYIKAQTHTLFSSHPVPSLQPTPNPKPIQPSFVLFCCWQSVAVKPAFKFSKSLRSTYMFKVLQIRCLKVSTASVLDVVADVVCHHCRDGCAGDVLQQTHSVSEHTDPYSPSL